MSASDCSLRLRTFHGPEAEELTVLCHPGSGSSDPSKQAEAAYRALADELSAHAATFGDVTSETIFVRDVRRDLPAILAARARVVEEGGNARGSASQPAFIGQAPADGAALAVLAGVVVPRERGTWSVRDVRAATSCDCDGCARSGARVVHLGRQASLQTTNLYGAGDDAYEQTLAAFRAGARLLADCGLGFADVVRTWLQLRDIDRDYDALNAARRDFFAESAIELRPASTGVGGMPFPDRHLVSLTLHALRRERPLTVTRMSTPLLNEAWSYGADFSRGLRVGESNKVTLHVSGTASIDDAGCTVHVGDFAAQATRMIDNLESLLAGQGATRDDLASGVTYLKHARDAAALHEIHRRRGFDRFPCAVVQADLCRPELLCETEVVAVLPPAAAPA